jgi:hypothetical protein
MAKIKTKPLDVVYFVSAYPNSDLLYSIRSVAENLEFNKLWIYGGKRSEIKPDEYVERRNQKGATKWARVRNMYLEVCQNDNITEDFILFHDDFFVLKFVDSLEPEYCATLKKLAETIEGRYGGEKTEYTAILRRTAEVLQNGGYSTKSYELHKPFVFNREKMLKILNDYPKEHCIRSIYANVYGVGGKSAQDVKISQNNDDYLAIVKNSDFISTNNDTWEHSSVGNWLRYRFSKPCRFEM